MTWGRELFLAGALRVLTILRALVGQDADLIVVGGSKGLRFADNGMHFFLSCGSNSGIRAVWLTHSNSVRDEVRREGREAHMVWSLKGLILGLRAAWHVFDVAPSDVGPTSQVGRRLNLWHGIPLKDISFLREAFERRRNRGYGEDWLLHTCRGELAPMLDAFPVAPGNVLVANLPRNGVLADSTNFTHNVKSDDRILRKQIQARLLADKTRCFGYFPTWRKGNSDRFLGCSSKEELVDLIDFLDRNGIVLLTKWHACTFTEYGHSDQSTIIEEIGTLLADFTNIIPLPFDADLNSYLMLCEVLITDYSSVFFDFLWLDRPIIFNPYDLDTYQRESGFNYDYASFVPGPVARSPEELKEYINQVQGDPTLVYQRHAAERSRMRARFFDTWESCTPIIDAIKQA